MDAREIGNNVYKNTNSIRLSSLDSIVISQIEISKQLETTVGTGVLRGIMYLWRKETGLAEQQIAVVSQTHRNITNQNSTKNSKLKRNIRKVLESWGVSCTCSRKTELE